MGPGGTGLSPPPVAKLLHRLVEPEVLLHAPLAPPVEALIARPYDQRYATIDARWRVGPGSNGQLATWHLVAAGVVHRGHSVADWSRQNRSQQLAVAALLVCVRMCVCIYIYMCMCMCIMRHHHHIRCDREDIKSGDPACRPASTLLIMTPASHEPSTPVHPSVPLSL